MKFFIDTANVEDIKKANDMGVICGVTTNPSLIAKEGRDFGEVIREIASIVDGPISGEVKATTEDAAGMIAEGREIAAIHPNMVVKIPMTVEGLKATKVLSAEGIKCNVTLIFSANQALLAARAGAAYVSPFLGRLDDISMPGIDLVRTIADMFAMYDDIHTEIIAASVRNPVHVTDCALAGADIATVPYSATAVLVSPSSAVSTTSFRISSMVISTSTPNAVDNPTAGSASIARIFLSGNADTNTFTIDAASEVLPTPPFPAIAIIFDSICCLSFLCI